MRLGYPFYQAASSNFTRGREGRPVRYVTVHHSAGWENTLRYLWGNPARGGSSHFWVGNVAGQIEQYVDTNDTAWTNGNWVSNTESITIEVRGDWRGYYDQQTLDNLQALILEIRKNYPNVQISYHKDVSDKITLCPAELKDRGWARAVWDNVTRILTAPVTPPTPPASKITYEPITPKRIQMLRVGNLWDFNFTDWASAKVVKTFGKDELIDVVAIATNALGGKYYMTAYSYNGGNIRSTNGINVVDAKDYVAPTPIPVPEVPTVPAIVFVPLENPRKLRTTRDLRVVDLTANVEVGDVIPANTDIDIVDKTTTADHKMYFRSKWANTNSKLWGVPADSMTELPTAPEVPVEPIPPTPIDTNPDTPGHGDIVVRLTALEKVVKYIVDFLKGLFSGFKPN